MSSHSSANQASSKHAAEINPIRPAGYKGLAGFHKYWGKKPTEAWRFLIERLTEDGQVVLDPFLGSGLIAKECTDLNRRFIGFDVNPISIELTKLYLDLPSHQDLLTALAAFEEAVKPAIYQMYRLANKQIATHFLWENEEITRVWTKAGRQRIELDLSATERQKLQAQSVYQSTGVRKLRLFDNSRINSKADFALSDLFTPRALQAIDLFKHEIDKYEGNVKRALQLILSASLGQMSKMVFAVTRRGKSTGKQATGIEVGSWVIGYWRPVQHFEVNAWNCFENKAKKLLNAIAQTGPQSPILTTADIAEFTHYGLDACLDVGDSELLLQQLKTESVRLILTDPPHGDRIPYLELSEMWNSVLGFEASYAEELVVSDAKGRHKDLAQYNRKLAAIFGECARVLENNGVLAVMFNARSTDHWHSLHNLEAATGLNYLGSYPLAYSAGSVAQDTRKGGLKTDSVLIYGKNVSPQRRDDILHIIRSMRGKIDVQQM
ncbi:MAG: DNA adenine methylase [Caldilineaceae bacterium]|nr:DNA adenine methylase [Caldilineaceae bacterium]